MFCRLLIFYEKSFVFDKYLQEYHQIVIQFGAIIYSRVRLRKHILVMIAVLLKNRPNSAKPNFAHHMTSRLGVK